MPRALDGVAQATSAAGKLPGQAHAGWRVLRALADELKLDGFGYTDLAGLRAGINPKSVQAGKGSAPAIVGNGLEVAASQAIYRATRIKAPEICNKKPLRGTRVVVICIASAYLCNVDIGNRPWNTFL